MRILFQIGGLFLLSLGGEVIADFLPFTVPAGVLCMIFLLLLFLFRLANPEALKETSDFLLQNIAFFFVPNYVGIMKYYGVMRSKAVQVILICVVSTLITFAATVYTVRLVVALQNKLGKEKNHE